MPRLQVYLPQDLYEQLKGRGLPASELLQLAVRAEVERLESAAAFDDYIAELAVELGEATPEEAARAEAIRRAVDERALHEAG